MTTPDRAPATSRGFPFGKLVVGVLAGFVLALGFGAGALLAYQGQYEERIYPGVTVDGVSVAGLSRDAAKATLERELAGYGAGEAVLTVEGTTLRIPYAAMGRRADVDTLIDLAWSVGRSQPDPLERAAEGVRSLLDGTRIGPLVLVDREAVAREVARVAEQVDRDPVDASAEVADAGFATTPAAAGRGLPARTWRRPSSTAWPTRQRRRRSSSPSSPRRSSRRSRTRMPPTRCSPRPASPGTSAS